MSEQLARQFHEIYERLALSFGYETRTETRAFEPTTPNGRLMIAVTDEIEATIQQRIAELTAELARLQEKLHDEMSQLEIATDLGNKRWLALNDIYENGEKHNTNWCKRKAQEGLGIK